MSRQPKDGTRDAVSLRDHRPEGSSCKNSQMPWKVPRFGHTLILGGDVTQKHVCRNGNQYRWLRGLQ